MYNINHPDDINPSETGNGGTSIGPGTSDQGFDPGEENTEDEFRNDRVFKNSREQILDKENETHAPPPTRGLVEEGPGPDS